MAKEIASEIKFSVRYQNTRVNAVNCQMSFCFFLNHFIIQNWENLLRINESRNITMYTKSTPAT